MRRLRILALMHEDLVPPEDISHLSEKEKDEVLAEWDVTNTLSWLGHEVVKLGVYDELRPIREAVERFRPHVAFNLLEEFHGSILYDQNVVSYLELLHLPYTGCKPRGLILSHDKALSKKILHYHRIRTPEFAVFPFGRKVKRPRRLEYPVIVKSLVADASVGISQASLVDSDEKLVERVDFIHRRLKHDAIAEQYIDGRELYVGVLGNSRLEVLPIWEMAFMNMPPDAAPIATERVKWDVAYQERRGITTHQAPDIPDELRKRIEITSKRIYRILDLCGYARMDYRLDSEGRFYLIEANSNPNIAEIEDFAQSAKAADIDYPTLLQRIVNLGMRRTPAEGK